VSDDDTLAIIPARGGSKGVERKNIRELVGKPLISYTIEAATASELVDRVVLSTDDEEIAAVASSAGAEVPFIRPTKLARDETSTEPVVTHALSELDEAYEQFVLLQPTSPLRTAEHVTAAIETYRSTDATSLLSVYRTKNYRWQRTEEGATQINFGGERSRRQEKRPEYAENGAIYITAVSAYLETTDFMAGRTELYEMRERDSVDIDTPFDLWLAEQLLQYEESTEDERS
jgi:N-acylneuraminate cytidylyltransferase/CMP-N,N'-diacetyllegionaminic acid synthase